MVRNIPTGGATTFSDQTNDELKLVAHRVGKSIPGFLNILRPTLYTLLHDLLLVLWQSGQQQEYF